MPQKTRTALLTDITTLLPDNDTGAISEADLRSIATDLADSTRFLGEAPAPHGHDAGEVSGLAPVATSGAYGDLTGQPVIPVKPPNAEPWMPKPVCFRSGPVWPRMQL